MPQNRGCRAPLFLGLSGFITLALLTGCGSGKSDSGSTSTPTPTITGVTATCAPTTVLTGSTSQCSANVSGTGSFASTVNWSVGGVTGGNSTLGTITAAGLYTAPTAVPATNPVTIAATSTQDSTKSGSASITVTAPAPTITAVAVVCAPVSVVATGTSQCSANVTGTGSFASTVTWSAGGIAGGNATLGTITAAGLYTAPATVPATNPVTITATSTQDTTKSGTASITITAPTITAVTVSCTPTSVTTSTTSQCSANVTGTGNFASTVTWSVGGIAGGNSTLGTITSAGLYTAPTAVPATNPVTITAISTQDTTKSGSASVTVTLPPTITAVTATCTPTSVVTTGTSQCSANVTGTGSFSSAVTWSVGGVAGGNSTLGTITSAGLYTAPTAVPTTNPVTITATSTANTAKSGSASVTITAPTITAVTAACTPTSVTISTTSQCAATVTGTGNFVSTVTWSVGGIAGGNSTLGTINSAGLYTAPATVPTTNPVTITATSTANTAKSGTASITVTPAPTITAVTATCTPTSVVTTGASQCTATVTGTGNFVSTVTWSVGGIAGGNSTLGTITSTGLYTAPAAIPTTNPVTITATSAANTAKSGSASVTITAPTITAVTATCTPNSAAIATTSQCTANVSGTGNYASTVTWSVGGIAGGTSTLGTINSAGLYTAPAAIPTTNPVTITATSTANTAKSGTASITITASTLAVSISSLSETSGSPFDALTITGAGFSLGTVAISVVFTPENGDPAVMVPVSASSAASIQAMVPAFFNSTTSSFTAETVDVQVILFSSSTTYLSNTINGLKVSVLPSVPSGVAAGAMTSELLSAVLNMSSTEQGLTSSTTNTSLAAIGTAFAQLNNDIYPLLSAATTIATTPSQTVSITTANGTSYTLSAQTLALSDQLAQALVAAIVTQGSIPAATGNTACPAATGNTAFDNNICAIQTYFQALAIQASPSLQHPPNGVRPALNVTPPDKALLGLFANLILGSIAEVAIPGAGGIVYALVGAPIVSAVIGSLGEDKESPTGVGPAAEYLTGVGTTILDDVAFGGIPVLGTTVDLYKTANALATYSPPEKSILLSSGSATVLPGAFTVLDPETGGSITTLQVPSAPAGGSFNSTSLVVSPYTTTYTLSTSTTGSGSGSITTFPTGTSFPAGLSVGVTATPASASSFAGWSGACSGTGTCSVTMNSSQSVSAAFNSISTVTDSINPSVLNLGSVGGCAGGALSSTITVTAAPGVTWTAPISGNSSNYFPITASPSSGSGTTVVVLTLTAPPVTVPQPFSCSDITIYPETQGTSIYFSDGYSLTPAINFNWIYVP